MSTTPAEPAQTPAQTPPQEPQGAEVPPTEPKPAEQPPAQETDWKAEARKWETRAKENSEAAKKLADIEEATKTEAQKQADKLAAAEAKVKDYEKREQIATWAKEVSEETGVPADVLSGSTKEELEAHAEKLKPLIGQQTTEEPRPGVVPTVGKTPAVPPNIPIGQQISAAEGARDQHAPGSVEWKAAQETVMALKGMQLAEVAKTT